MQLHIGQYNTSQAKQFDLACIITHQVPEAGGAVHGGTETVAVLSEKQLTQLIQTDRLRLTIDGRGGGVRGDSRTQERSNEMNEICT